MLTDWMFGRLLHQGAVLDNVYNCLSCSEYGIGRYGADSLDRKPTPGMLPRAGMGSTIDLRRSVLLGNKDSEIWAGLAARVGYPFLFNSIESNKRLSMATAMIDLLSGAVPFSNALVIDKEAIK